MTIHENKFAGLDISESKTHVLRMVLSQCEKGIERTDKALSELARERVEYAELAEVIVAELSRREADKHV